MSTPVEDILDPNVLVSRVRGLLRQKMDGVNCTIVCDGSNNVFDDLERGVVHVEIAIDWRSLFVSQLDQIRKSEL